MLKTLKNDYSAKAGYSNELKLLNFDLRSEQDEKDLSILLGNIGKYKMIKNYGLNSAKA